MNLFKDCALNFNWY